MYRHNKKFRRERLKNKFKDKRNKKLIDASKWAKILYDKYPAKLCAKCKIRRKSKYHHFLCDYCWLEKKRRLESKITT